jgi:hypothetical protein
MRFPIVLAVGFTLAGWSGLALADPGKDESGKGRRGGYERYGYGGDWDGPRERKIKVRTADGCEIERKWKKGEYEEKVKCKPSRYGYRY